MKKEFEKRVKKELPNSTLPKLLCIFGLAIITGIVLLLLTEKGVFLPKPVEFDASGEENVYSQFTVYRLTDSFASFADDSGNAVDYAAYFIVDNGKCNVAVMDSETRSKLDSIYNYTVNGEGDEPTPITVTGISTKMESDLQSTAISSFRTFFNVDSAATDDDVISAIGTNYIEVGMVPGSPMYAISVLIMLLGLAGFLIVLGIRISLSANQKRAEKQSPPDYDKILSEIDGAYINKTSKTIITENYIIGSGGLGVYGAFSKDEAIWAYSKVGRVNLVAATDNVYVQLKDGSFAVCASCGTSGEKNKNDFDDAKKHIFEALPDVIVGLTKENMLKAKKIIDGEKK